MPISYEPGLLGARFVRVSLNFFSVPGGEALSRSSTGKAHFSGCNTSHGGCGVPRVQAPRIRRILRIKKLKISCCFKDPLQDSPDSRCLPLLLNRDSSASSAICGSLSAARRSNPIRHLEADRPLASSALPDLRASPPDKGEAKNRAEALDSNARGRCFPGEGQAPDEAMAMRT
jgi:hypothetical protein